MIPPITQSVKELEDYVKLKELRSEIEKHNRLYYVENNPEISDTVYDWLYRNLVALEERYPHWDHSTSPSKQVGHPVVNKSKKAKLFQKMYSLKNYYNLEDILAWMNKIRKTHPNAEFVAEGKADGVSIELHYSKYILVKAILRGDGIEGELVTRNAMLVAGIPKMIPGYQDDLVVRGEVVWTEVAMNLHNLTNKKQYKNVRNAVSGLMRGSDLSIGHHLQFIPWQVVHSEFASGFYQHSHQLQWVTDLGIGSYGNTSLEIVNNNHLSKLIESFKEIKKSNVVPLDGVVIKVDDVKLYEELGYTDKYPLWALAYKFPDEAKETILNDITIQMGRTGVLTPVAHFNPIEMGGTTVSKTSLYNFSKIEELGLKINERILVERSAEVIPNVVGLANPDKPSEHAIKIKEPSHCPFCLSKLVKEGPKLFCPNEVGCRERLVYRVIYFAQALGIKGLGEAIVRDMVETGQVVDPADLFSLTSKRIAALSSVKGSEKLAQKLFYQITDATRNDPGKVIVAMGIGGVGAVGAPSLAVGMVGSGKGLKDVFEMDEEQLKRMGMLGDSARANLVKFCRNPANKNFIDKLITIFK